MRILTWNLNHRAARRKIPRWVAEEVALARPNVIVFTEYVEGPDHDRFLGELRNAGLAHVCTSPPVPRHNQILIGSDEPIYPGPVTAPALHPAVPPNFCHVRTKGWDIFGFRLPAFSGADEPLKLQVWGWLQSTTSGLPQSPAVLIGDFNTALDDPPRRGGDHLRGLLNSGWQLAQPPNGYSWKRDRTTRAIDHALIRGWAGRSLARYDWGFQQRHPAAAMGHVGCPDHAMLVVDLFHSDQSHEAPLGNMT